MPVKIFFCYAREDELLRQGLEKQLRVLRRQGLIDIWHDREISAGMEWEHEIKKHLNVADIILLLVSPDFIDSDYCYGVEMKRALERHELGEACVIPVILRPVFWQRTPFGKLQALPKDGIPVTDPSWQHLDQAFFNVAEGIREKAEQTILTHRFKEAYLADNDEEIIAIYDEIQRSPYRQLITFSDQEQQRIHLAQQARNALHFVQNALSEGKPQNIVKASTSSYFDIKRLNESERAHLMLAQRFVDAILANDDTAILTVFNEIENSHGQRSFILSSKEQQRINLAQRHEATRQFQSILQRKNLEEIVAAYSHDQDKIDLTDQEQKQIALACQFIQAYHDNNYDSLIATYNDIVALDYDDIFTFTEQQIRSISIAHRRQKRVEQLWYTWSLKGLGSTSGYQIRAASEGLQHVGNRMQDLGRYLHYHLPLGANAYDIPIEMAPISLAFILTEEGERILVNRTYIGRDPVNRPGAFFCHLLAGLPEEFTVKKAIGLWRSSLWMTSDASLDPQSLTLPRLSLEELDSIQGSLEISFMQDRMKMQQYLPSFIQAYLTRRAQQQIYIVAPADDIACLILGLAHSLPQKLLANLTFNTYEYDATTATEQIVGTCWLASSFGPADAYEWLPSFLYEKGIVINTYSNRISVLENNSLAYSFAKYATECLLQRHNSLLPFLEKAPVTSIEAFLSFFENTELFSF